jgi:hypothetical protein
MFPSTVDVITGTLLKIQVFLNVTLCRLTVTDVSKHRVASSPRSAPLWLLEPEEEGTSEHSKLSISRHGVTSQKARIYASVVNVGQIIEEENKCCKKGTDKTPYLS